VKEGTRSEKIGSPLLIRVYSRIVAGVFGGCFNTREFFEKIQIRRLWLLGRVGVSNPLSSPRCEVYTSDSQGKPSERGGNGQIVSNIGGMYMYLSNIVMV
jgi:hypothetical protein